MKSSFVVFSQDTQLPCQFLNRTFQCYQMLGIFPIHGIFNSSLGQIFDLLGITKTHKSLGILTSGTKIGLKAAKKVQNTEIWAQIQKFSCKIRMRQYFILYQNSSNDDIMCYFQYKTYQIWLDFLSFWIIPKIPIQKKQFFKSWEFWWEFQLSQWELA